MRKVIAQKTNGKGRTYSIQQEGDTFGVWALHENYCRHAKGGIARTWRYVERGLTREAADKLFARRTK